MPDNCVAVSVIIRNAVMTRIPSISSYVDSCCCNLSCWLTLSLFCDRTGQREHAGRPAPAVPHAPARGLPHRILPRDEGLLEGGTRGQTNLHLPLRLSGGLRIIHRRPIQRRRRVLARCCPDVAPTSQCDVDATSAQHRIKHFL